MILILNIDSEWCHVTSIPNAKANFVDNIGVKINFMNLGPPWPICSGSLLIFERRSWKRNTIKEEGLECLPTCESSRGLMPCWGCLSNTTWRSKWEICCLLCASVCHQSKRGSAGCSTLLSTFSEKLTTCRSNPALKRAPVAPALFPWWRHALIFQPPFLSVSWANFKSHELCS